MISYPVSAAINHLLAQEPWAREKLARHAGKIALLDGGAAALKLKVAGDGMLQIERRHVFPDAEAGEHQKDAPLTFQSATRRFQEQLLRKALADTGWNITETASRLDLARSHVHNLVRAFGLERKRP